MHSSQSRPSSRPTSRPASRTPSVRGSPRMVSGEEMVAMIHEVVNDPTAKVQLPLQCLPTVNQLDDSENSGPNSLPASIDLLSPSPPEFKKPNQPRDKKLENQVVPYTDGIRRLNEINKENTPPYSPTASNPSSPTQRSPIIRSHDSQRAQYHSPVRSSQVVSDHLSPRLGLPVSNQNAASMVLSRFRHTRPFPPSRPIGDLTGNLPMFLEMRSFKNRPSTSLTPERHQRERGRKYFDFLKIRITLTFTFRAIKWYILFTKYVHRTEKEIVVGNFLGI